jgi:hypothetical protein
MCIIVVKQKDIEVPTKEILENCFASNSDGAGFMVSRKGNVIITKGLMTFEKFWSSFSKAKIAKKDTCIIHFRIATHGLTNEANTHPFPVSSDHGLLSSTQIVTDVGVAHNGMIRINCEENMSDTFTFVKQILGNQLVKEHIQHPAMLALLAKAIGGSRLALLWGNDDIKLLGEGWRKDEKGVIYSNDSYRYQRIIYPSNQRFSTDAYSAYYKAWEERFQGLRNNTKASSNINFIKGEIVKCKNIVGIEDTGSILEVGKLYEILEITANKGMHKVFLKVKGIEENSIESGWFTADRFVNNTQPIEDEDSDPFVDEELNKLKSESIWDFDDDICPFCLSEDEGGVMDIIEQSDHLYKYCTHCGRFWDEGTFYDFLKTTLED